MGPAGVDGIQFLQKLDFDRHREARGLVERQGGAGGDRDRRFPVADDPSRARHFRIQFIGRRSDAEIPGIGFAAVNGEFLPRCLRHRPCRRKSRGAQTDQRRRQDVFHGSSPLICHGRRFSSR